MTRCPRLPRVLAYALLRWRAWLVCRAEPGLHPVAALVAAGNWRALDSLIDEMET